MRYAVKRIHTGLTPDTNTYELGEYDPTTKKVARRETFTGSEAQCMQAVFKCKVAGISVDWIRTESP